jgi:diacylglycerol kinase family enzyme
MPIPAFVNPKSGSAERALAALADDPRFEAHQIDPATLAARVREEAARGTPRVLVSGGDGTIGPAAGAAAGTGLELAVLPGGTLNHFARDFGIPLDDFPAALEIAATGVVRPVDLGYVNDRAILNTSSVGLYSTFVRTRERLEPSLGYYVASAVAAVRVWSGLRGFKVEFETSDGRARRYRSPLLFVGVGERALERAAQQLGARLPAGAHSLHVLVVRANTPSRVLGMALGAVTKGLQAMAKTDVLDAFLVPACTVTLRRPWGTVSIDGELVRMKAPLSYRLERGAVKVVGPAPDDEPNEGLTNA